MVIGLTGCGEDDAEPTSLENLADGVFYISHEDGTFETPYIGESTLKRYSNSNDRILWFKDDFKNIPTFHKGDTLVYYTESVFPQEFYFERFNDLGYTIGLRGIEAYDTGRVYVTTDENSMLTYPNGDTDEINSFTNSLVIIESLGGVKLRSSKMNDILSDHKTLTGLVKDNVYKAEIYVGTVRHDMDFKADVRVLGSMGTLKTSDYEFTRDKIIEIQIPEWFNEGYYFISGQGVFRYIKEGEYTHDIEQVDESLNIENDIPEEYVSKFTTGEVDQNDTFMSEEEAESITFIVDEEAYNTYVSNHEKEWEKMVIRPDDMSESEFIDWWFKEYKKTGALNPNASEAVVKERLQRNLLGPGSIDYRTRLENVSKESSAELPQKSTVGFILSQNYLNADGTTRVIDSIVERDADSKEYFFSEDYHSLGYFIMVVNLTAGDYDTAYISFSLGNDEVVAKGDAENQMIYASFDQREDEMIAPVTLHGTDDTIRSIKLIQIEKEAFDKVGNMRQPRKGQ